MATSEALQVLCWRLKSSHTPEILRISSANLPKVTHISNTSTADLAKNARMLNLEVQLIVFSKAALLTRPPDTYRFFLHHCQCRLILLALCHDNGYIAELDKYRNDARATQKTLLIDHYAKGQAFIDPPFPIIKLDDVFSTKPLYVRRTKGSVSLTNQSPYASALAASPTAGQPPIPRQSSFSRLPPWSKPASGTQSTIATPHQSQQTLIKEPHAPYLAPGVDPPTSSDQIPIVRTSFQ
jgi:hypothetical protein